MLYAITTARGAMHTTNRQPQAVADVGGHTLDGDQSICSTDRAVQKIDRGHHRPHQLPGDAVS